MNKVIEREMSISHLEFYRLIPIAFRDFEYQISNNEITLSYAGGTIKIEPGEELERKIASLKLPVLNIKFKFSSISENDVSSFMAGFTQTYQRGGG